MRWMREKKEKLFMPRIKWLLMKASLRSILWFFFAPTWFWLVKARTNRIDMYSDRQIHSHTSNKKPTIFALSLSLCLRMTNFSRRIIWEDWARGAWEEARRELWMKRESKLPVTMLISSSWLRWLDELSDKLELAELNGWSDGQGDGGPPLFIKRENVW